MTELGTTTQTVLSAATPFDLGCSLRALRDFHPAAHDNVVEEGWVRRAFLHPSDPSAAVVTQVTDRDDGEPGVALTVFSAAPLTGPELTAVAGEVSAWLGLDDDRTGFLRAAAADEPVRPL